MELYNDIELFEECTEFHCDGQFINTDGERIVDPRVKKCKEIFLDQYRFFQPIGSFDVSIVTNMSEMFMWSKYFNQDIGTNGDAVKLDGSTSFDYTFGGAIVDGTASVYANGSGNASIFSLCSKIASSSFFSSATFSASSLSCSNLSFFFS